MSTYKRLPVSFERGEGCRLWDAHGNSYLDALSGIAVCGLGHSHPRITQAICEQAGRLLHTSNLYGIPAQAELGERLTRLAGMERVFFSNSGAEANEAAIKLARLFGRRKKIDKPVIAVTEGSFHGRTMATLTATGNRKVQAGFEPLLKGFVRVPYGDAEALETIAEREPNLVAILVEPVQGEGGINIPPNDYLPRLRALCDQHELLLMLDEIQTGMGRTGQPFAYQHHDLKPDVMTVAKALGNGVPIGACLANGVAAELFGPGSHGSTFGGNPLVCHTGLAVLDVLEQGRLWERAATTGTALLNGFRDRLGSLPCVRDIRGKGLMIGIELQNDCGELVAQALQQGLLINVTAGNVIRLLPPLILEQEQVDELLTKLSGLVRNFCAAA